MKTTLMFDPAWMDAIQTLGDAEKGRLLWAYIKYSLGEEPEELRGNEKYVWPTILAGINNSRKRSEIYRGNADKRWHNCNAIAMQTYAIAMQTDATPY